jgi:hypothetical protein
VRWGVTVTGTAALLAELSAWIDQAVPGTETERLWGRTAKVAEEYGEVVAAIIGYLGQNPRKGRTNGLDEVIVELLDVATAALGAVESLTGNQGRSLMLLGGKVAAVHERMRAYRSTQEQAAS